MDEGKWQQMMGSVGQETAASGRIILAIVTEMQLAGLDFDSTSFKLPSNIATLILKWEATFLRQKTIVQTFMRPSQSPGPSPPPSQAGPVTAQPTPAQAEIPELNDDQLALWSKLLSSEMDNGVVYLRNPPASSTTLRACLVQE
jgi:hypothetical protein